MCLYIYSKGSRRQVAWTLRRRVEQTLKSFTPIGQDSSTACEGSEGLARRTTRLNLVCERMLLFGVFWGCSVTPELCGII